MNYKVLYKGLLFAGIGLLIIFTLIYFFLLLGPSLKKVAEFNKKISELQLKIKKYREFSSRFKGIDDKEKSLIEKVGQIYREKFPEKENMEALTDYFASLIKDFQEKAKLYKLHQLAIESRNSFIQISLGTSKARRSGSPVKFSSLQQLRLNSKEKDDNRPVQIKISYLATVEDGIHFVQDMLYSYPALQLNRLEMKRKKGLTSFEVIFKVKTRDKEG